jgi:hypothetical protein
VRFARVVFLIAGIWGLLVLTPLYFAFDIIGQKDPPAITHPSFYFGFVIVAIAWQIAFLFIARDPVRLRPLMVPAMIEKFGYVTTLGTRFGGCSCRCRPAAWHSIRCRLPQDQ